MPKSKLHSNRNEIQVSKSPAEFFAENQAISGFDNLGKSLYTTIREFVENSLDACECMNILPDIKVSIEEMTQGQFNTLRGVNDSNKGGYILDEGLFYKSKCKKGDLGVTKGSTMTTNHTVGEEGETKDMKEEDSINKKKCKSKKNVKTPRNEEYYFKITVRDNGSGIDHEAIPNLFGIVLSGSKYGVIQTRGKFGLGAKMALIWSKKSTGVPIKIKTAHMEEDKKRSKYYSTCVLDININRNLPKVLEHKKYKNDIGWSGTELEVIISGNWTTYRSRIVQYLQQLAIITPYAKLEMHYTNLSDNKKDMSVTYKRRSDQMPPPAREVKHHPSSINNLLVQQLLDKTECKTFLKFLCQDLSGVSLSIGKRVIAELGKGFSESKCPLDITGSQITQLVQLLRRVEIFKPPDGSCLSPLGEYNLMLGIRKVFDPEIVATTRDRASAYDGHPFIVEAAVSLGGKGAKEGITVFRFANRIPLLFEGGADVVNRVAQSKIKWSSYKIDHKRDKIGVFLSIVSTKIPFKGTGKEYIGDDITEIQLSVKRSLQMCCQQLRSHVTKRNALKNLREKRSRLVKYVPDVSRSLFGILENMKRRKLEIQREETANESEEHVIKSYKLDSTFSSYDQGEKSNDIISKINSNTFTEQIIANNLVAAIEMSVDVPESTLIPCMDLKKNTKKRQNNGDSAQPIYIVPHCNFDEKCKVSHPLFTFLPLKKIEMLVN